MRVTRRSLLRGGLITTGALATGGASACLWLRGCAPEVAGLRVLDAHHYATLERLVDTLFSPGASFGVDVAALDLPRAFDGYLADEPEDVVSDLKSALILLEVGPVIDGRSAQPFSRMSREGREAFFRAWMGGDDLTKRKITVALRKFFNLSLYDRPEMWRHIGYPGPALGGG